MPQLFIGPMSFDMITGKNATFMDDPFGTGMGQGAGDKRETRFNINFEYYF